MGRKACTEPQCLYKCVLYLYWLYQYPIFSASYLIISVRSPKMFYGNIHNWVIAQYPACHYDPVSQNVRLKKAMKKCIFFCFSATMGNLREDLRVTFNCCRNKFNIKALLCNIQSFYRVLNNEHRILCCVPTATVVTRTRHNITYISALRRICYICSQSSPLKLSWIILTL